MHDTEIRKLLDAAERMFIAAGFDGASVEVAGRTVYFDRAGRRRGEAFTSQGELVHFYVIVQKEKLGATYQPGRQPIYQKYDYVLGVDETSMSFQLAVLEAIPQFHEKLKFESSRVAVAKEKLMDIAQELLERYKST